MAKFDERKEKYRDPKPYRGDLGTNGYPNNVANTQTLKTRGTGKAVRGNKHSTKMG